MTNEVEQLQARVSTLEAENAKLKTLIAVAYDERDHWHGWFRRKEKWANIWRRAAVNYRNLPRNL